MKKLILRTALGLLLLAALAAALVIIARPYIKQAALSWFDRHGLKELSLAGATFGLNSLTLNSLAFNYHIGAGELELRLDTATLQFDLSQLLEQYRASGSIQTRPRLHTSGGSIRFTSAPEANSQASSTPTFDPAILKLGPELVERALGTVPLQALSITDLAVLIGPAPALTLSLDLVRDSESQLKARVSSEQGALKVEGGYSESTKRGALKFFTEPQLKFSEEHPLSSLVKSWNYPFDIRQGILSIEGTLPIDAAAAKPQLRVGLKDAGVFVENFPSQVVQFQAELKELSPLVVSVATQAEMIHAPIPLQKVKVAARILGNDAIQIDKFDSEVLGGSIAIRNGRFVFSNSKLSLPVQISGLELSKLLELYPQEQVAATGAVDAEFTFDRGAPGMSIKAGKLQSRAPGGTIQYRPRPEQLESSPALRMTAEALKNFEYSALNGEVTLIPAGDLTLAIKLEGRNPEWQRGQPVDLNLNIDQNIFNLLRSIALSQGKDEVLDKAIDQVSGRHGTRK